MPRNIKIFFGLLALAAVFSVLSFFDVFQGVRSANLLDPTKPLPPNYEDDADQDGLSDADESYWNTDFQNPDSDGDGFLDGEEVASSHDPTAPGPDDAIFNSNTTQRLANLTVSGLVEGSLKNTSPNYEDSINAVTLSVVDDSLVSFAPEINRSQFKKIEPTKKNQDIYIQQIDFIWEKFYKALIQEIGEIDSKLEFVNNGGMANPKFIEYFISQREIFDSITREGMQIPVPENWSDKHADLIAYISKFSKVNDSLAKGKDDPIRATIGFNLFAILIDDFSTVLKPFSEN